MNNYTSFLHDSMRNTFVWTTANGRKYLLRDMTNSHVINCIFFVAARLGNGYTAETLNTFINEANYRGLRWSAPVPYDERKELVKDIKDGVDRMMQRVPSADLQTLRELAKVLRTT